MNRSTKMLTIRLAMAAICVAAMAAVAAPKSEAALTFTGCPAVHPGYSSITSHRICSWEGEMWQGGVQYYTYLQSHQSLLSYDGQWREDKRRTYLLQAWNGSWYFHSCRWYFPNGFVTNC